MGKGRRKGILEEKGDGKGNRKRIRTKKRRDECEGYEKKEGIRKRIMRKIRRKDCEGYKRGEEEKKEKGRKIEEQEKEENNKKQEEGPCEEEKEVSGSRRLGKSSMKVCHEKKQQTSTNKISKKRSTK